MQNKMKELSCKVQNTTKLMRFSAKGTKQRKNIVQLFVLKTKEEEDAKKSTDT